MKCEICGTELVRGVCPECGGGVNQRGKKNSTIFELERLELNEDSSIKKHNPKARIIKVSFFLLVFGILLFNAGSPEALFRNTKESAAALKQTFLSEQEANKPVAVALDVQPVQAGHVYNEGMIQKLVDVSDECIGEKVVVGGVLYENPFEGDENISYMYLHHGDPQKENGMIIEYKENKVQIEGDEDGRFAIVEGKVVRKQKYTYSHQDCEDIVIHADKIIKTNDYGEAYDPSIYVANDIKGAVINHSNLQAAVTKIEYARQQTRVYMNVENNTGLYVLLYPLRSELKERNTIMTPHPMKGAMWSVREVDLKPGEQYEGVLVFDQTDPTQTLEFSMNLRAGDNPTKDKYKFAFSPSKRK